MFHSGLIQENEQGVQFRHALIQAAVYQSQPLLLCRETHRRIARTLQSLAPEVCRAEPVILAHHLTRAGEIEPAIQYWCLAAESAARYSGHHEAASHYRKALGLLAALPDESGRVNQKLSLTTSLGMPLVFAVGFGSAEVQEIFAQAYALWGDSTCAEQIFPVVYGRWMTAGSLVDYRYSIELARQMDHLAASAGRPDFGLAAHLGQLITSFWMGRFAEIKDHAARVSELCRWVDPER
ncbi:MAG: hypothetical protein FIA97_03080 [Methylococcaceae bacterium]|nr:hypothetical protein [Methylococcaceae bacterium]